ncbi:MAG TPA: phospholipase D-like domain-containing protein, partial [Stenomitos sp.]
VMAKGKPVQYDTLKPNVTYGSVRTQTLVTSPPEGRFEAKQAIYQAIELAQREVVVENQYLWDQGLTDRLLAAARRGVSVRVIVPGKSDSFKYLHAVAMNQILKAGGQAKLYSGIPDTAHVHTKYFCVDDRWATIGSVNGDTRALIDNQELDVALADPGMIQQLKTRLFEKDWQSSSVVYEFKESPFFDGAFSKLWQILDYYL